MITSFKCFFVRLAFATMNHLHAIQMDRTRMQIYPSFLKPCGNYFLRSFRLRRVEVESIDITCLDSLPVFLKTFFLRFLVWHCKAAKCTGVRLIGKKEIVFKGILSTWCFWKHAVADIQQRVSTNQSTSSFFVGFFSLKFLLTILHRWFGFISSVSD